MAGKVQRQHWLTAVAVGTCSYLGKPEAETGSTGTQLVFFQSWILDCRRLEDPPP